MKFQKKKDRRQNQIFCRFCTDFDSTKFCSFVIVKIYNESYGVLGDVDLNMSKSLY